MGVENPLGAADPLIANLPLADRVDAGENRSAVQKRGNAAQCTRQRVANVAMNARFPLNQTDPDLFSATSASVKMAVLSKSSRTNHSAATARLAKNAASPQSAALLQTSSNNFVKSTKNSIPSSPQSRTKMKARHKNRKSPSWGFFVHVCSFYVIFTISY